MFVPFSTHIVYCSLTGAEVVCVGAVIPRESNRYQEAGTANIKNIFIHWCNRYIYLAVCTFHCKSYKYFDVR